MNRPTSDRLGHLLARIYPDLRRIAATRAASIGASPSSLAQEACCRIVALPDPPETPEHALALGCRLMEWTRIDRLRSDIARRDRERSLEPPQREPTPSTAADNSLAEALLELGRNSPRKAEILMLSAVCGLTQKQIAEMLDVTVRTVQRDLDFSRAWLASRLGVTIDGRDE